MTEKNRDDRGSEFRKHYNDPMPNDDVIIRFDNVSFEYGQKPILAEAVFSVRQGMKMTLMGQNGAGKTTIFQLIMGALKPEEGAINIEQGLTMAIGRQVIPRDEMDLTVREFFEKAFPKKIYDIEPRIKKILDVVHLDLVSTPSSVATHRDFRAKAAQPDDSVARPTPRRDGRLAAENIGALAGNGVSKQGLAPLEKKLRDFSGGQQARLLLAQALIQDPDILLLDEPTNNLDAQGIAHLTEFLIAYPKTCLVISHDAEFLNAFTHGVLYLDVFTHKVEQYIGNYLAVVEEIKARLERERKLNVRLEKDIQHRKNQANFFAQKGGHMRDVARKMNEKIAELEEDIVETRQEDKTIRNFAIPAQPELSGRLLELKSVSFMKGAKIVTKKVEVALKKNERLLLAGPNGVGKTTLLEMLATAHAKGEHVTPGTRISYYRQDFSTLDFDKSVYDTLADAMDGASTIDQLRSTAAGFLLDAHILRQRVGALSEGQKGLVAFAKISLERPGLLFLDEPTNHINFRHIPVIAKALDRYEGAMILVSHVPDFVKQIRIDYTLDLGKL
jgi:ATP-binding cassette subfamily F protein 3